MQAENIQARSEETLSKDLISIYTDSHGWTLEGTTLTFFRGSDFNRFTTTFNFIGGLATKHNTFQGRKHATVEFYTYEGDPLEVLR